MTGKAETGSNGARIGTEKRAPLIQWAACRKPEGGYLDRIGPRCSNILCEFRPWDSLRVFTIRPRPNTALHQFSAFRRFPIASKKRDR
jgi:hypothetical protein